MSEESLATPRSESVDSKCNDEELKDALEKHLDEQFRALVQEAFRLWSGPGRFQIIKDFQGGHSGAAVLKVDLSYGPGLQGDLPGGGYILKVYRVKSSRRRASEQKLHDEARAATHGEEIRIPELKREHTLQDETGERCALLYQIAGDSSTQLTTLEDATHELHRLTGELALGLLRQWSRGTGAAMTGRELLDTWLGRLDRDSRPNVHKLIENVFGNDASSHAAGKSLVNPLWLYEHCGERNDREVHFPGFLHGDLHLGNVLIERRSQDRPPFWLIDFALAKNGAPIGYDQSYLEISLILYFLGDSTREQVVNLCEAVEQPQGKERIPPGNRALLEMLRGIRHAASQWHAESGLARLDEFRRQFTLSRVAAGLNWADKEGGPEGSRLLALHYAAWNARRYVEEFIPSLWERLQAGNPEEDVAQSTAKEVELWQRIWKATKGFDSRQTRFILIADRQLPSEQLSSIGLLPWSAVIDLDAESDESGLHKSAIGTLRSQRAVREFSLSRDLIDFERGTAWMLAAGWKRRGESAPDLKEWRIDNRRNVRDFLQRFSNAVGSIHTVVILLPRPDGGKPEDRDRLDLLADVVSEAFGGSASAIQLGPQKPIVPGNVEHIPLQVSRFLQNVTDIFGSQVVSENVSLPSIDGDGVEISVESLREFEEDLELLHSRVLSDPQGLPKEGDSEFWRGSAPTWHDINAGRDVPRGIEASLEEQLRAALSNRRIYTVELRHQPGSGGSTLARRLAWKLRREYPVAILRSRSKHTATLLAKLFHTTGLPVLLVADAGTINDTERLALMSELRDHNSRLVMLYVKRVVGRHPDGDAGPASERERVNLQDPMPEEEAHSFLEAFSSFTDDSRRLAELRKITEQKDYERYRSPFFYGLITFERDFKSVDHYVRSHTKQVNRNTREILEYLSLLTRFSKISVHESLVKRLLNIRSGNAAPLRDALGDGPWGLLLAQEGRVKILHPVIAEEILRHFSTNEDWRLDLADLSMRLIEDLAHRLGTSSEEVIELLTQLLINREDALSTATDDLSEQRKFSELIDTIDFAGEDGESRRAMAGHRVLETLVEFFPDRSHFWNHLGRHRARRLEQNLEIAVENLEEAIRLDPKTSVHHHAHGTILYVWIRQDLLAELMRSRRKTNSDPVTPATMLELIRERFELAQASFAVARDIAPYEEYAYVTEIQMILAVAKMLKRAAKAESIAELQAQENKVGEWLASNITTAEDLYYSAREVQGSYEVRRFSYLGGCRRDMDLLHGHLLKVIKDWEAALYTGRTNPRSRRGLANLYLAKASRDRSKMPVRDARRVAQLIERNLSSGGEDADFRLWFNAYSVLPEFEIEHAIFRLQQWADRLKRPLRAYYYLYILEFVAWFHGERHQTDELVAYEHRVQEAAEHFPRIRSYEWLGYENGPCPIVGEDSLGEWVELETSGNADASSPRRFWSNTSPLRRINGVIDNMNGMQSGTILIGGTVTAFFVPGTQFWNSLDRHKKVNFFLGFSYSGLRAWMVEEGHIDGGSRRKTTDDPVRLPLGDEVTAPPETLDAAARQALMTSVHEFLLDMLEIREVRDEPLMLADVTDRLDSALDSDNVVEQLGFASLASLATRFHDITIVVGDGDGAEIQRRSGSPRQRTASRVTATGTIKVIKHEDEFGYIAPDRGKQDLRFTPADITNSKWSELRSGQRVAYFASRSGRFLTAKNVSPIKIENHRVAEVTKDLRAQATAFVKEFLFQAALDKKQVAIDSLEDALRQEVLKGMSVRSALGYPSLEEFLANETKDVEVKPGAHESADAKVVSAKPLRPRPVLGEALIVPAIHDKSTAARTGVQGGHDKKKGPQTNSADVRRALEAQVCDAGIALLNKTPKKQRRMKELSAEIRGCLGLTNMSVKKQLGKPLAAVLGGDRRFALSKKGLVTMVGLAAAPKSSSQPKREGAVSRTLTALKPPATQTVVEHDRELAVRHALEILQFEMTDERGSVSWLGNVVAKRFPPDIPLRKRLKIGFLHLLEIDERFEVSGSGADATVQLSRAFAQGRKAVAMAPDVSEPTEKVAPDDEQISAHVREIVSEEEPDGILLTSLGSRLLQRLRTSASDTRSFKQITGIPLAKYIERQVNGVEITGEPPRQLVRRLKRKAK